MSPDLVESLIEDVRHYLERQGIIGPDLSRAVLGEVELRIRTWLRAQLERGQAQRISGPEFLAYFHSRLLLTEIDRLRAALRRSP